MMTSKGVVWLTQQPPLATTAHDGTFVLSMLTNPGEFGASLRRLIWAGERAQDFWQQNRHRLQPGAALHVCTRRDAVFVNHELNQREIQTHVVFARVLEPENNPAMCQTNPQPTYSLGRALSI